MNTPEEYQQSGEALLFAVPETLSPRLAWMRKHEIRTNFCESLKDSPWCAWLPEDDFDDHGTIYNGDDDSVGFGLTKDDAVIKLAKKKGIRLWNEGGAA